MTPEEMDSLVALMGKAETIADARARAWAVAGDDPAPGTSAHWSIEEGEFVGRWTYSACGDHSDEEIWMPLAAITADDDTFAKMVEARRAERDREIAARDAAAKAQREAAERAEYERLATRYGPGQ